MATTTITMESFQTALAECADAIESGDFATAWKKLAKAETIQNGLSVRAGIGNGTTNEMRTSLDRSKVLLEAAESAVSRGNQRRLVTTRTNFNR